jgi:hypothetical protein
MRGPDDVEIAELLEPGVTGGNGEAPAPPAGGKALLRLLELLGSSGYEDAAKQALDLAVPPEEQDEFRTRLNEFVTVTGLPATNGAGKKTSSRRKTASKNGNGAVAIAEAVAQAHLDAAEELGPPTPTGPQWRSLGPWTIPNGQTYGATRVNVSGRIAAIAVDPASPAHVLVGAANGGIWESFDRGASWAPRTDYQATLAVGAIAFDRTNPKIVFGGLGEGNWWWWLGTGVIRSTDGGTTWSPIATAPFVGQGFFDLVVDPANGQHLLAATTGGLYVSTNGGVNWTQRRSARTFSISIAPGGGPNAEILAASSDGIWRSTNGGQTWSAVTLPGSPGSFTRLAVSIAPSNGAVAYAWGAGPPNTSNGPTPYLWRRASGNTWAAMGPPPGVATGQSWYDWFLAVSPDNPNQIYCGAISVHRGTLIRRIRPPGLIWAWVDIATKTSGDSIHPDSHAIAFEPGNPNLIYVGNDGGLFQSPNRGINWVHRNNGLIISEFEFVAQDYGSSRWIIGGTQDNGTERWRGSPTWDHVADGDGGDSGINRASPTTEFHTFYGMSPQRSTTSGDWGTWTSVFPPVPANEGSPFYPPFECSSTNGDTIAMGGNALYVSRNSGGAWTRLPYPSGGTASGMYVPNADTVLVGLTDGRVLKTTWTGAAWNALSALATPRAGAVVSDLKVDPNNVNRMWATYSSVGGGRVYRSDDAGAHWTDVTGNLPNLPVNAIDVDPWNGNRAWVAASVGVYQTTGGGTTWTDFSASLPNAWIGDVLFHPHARVLRAATRNRGVWEIPVDGWLTTPICGVQWQGHLNPNQTQKWFTFNWPATWNIVWTVMPTTVHNGTPSVRWNVEVERASAEFATYWITVQNLLNIPVDFEGRYAILSRY